MDFVQRGGDYTSTIPSKLADDPNCGQAFAINYPLKWWSTSATSPLPIAANALLSPNNVKTYHRFAMLGSQEPSHIDQSEGYCQPVAPSNVPAKRAQINYEPDGTPSSVVTVFQGPVRVVKVRHVSICLNIGDGLPTIPNSIFIKLNQDVIASANAKPKKVTGFKFGAP